MTQTHGPVLSSEGVTFQLWAPAAQRVELAIDGQCIPMQRRTEGWFSLFVRGAGAGALYRFRIDGELSIPDPASRFQPQDLAGPSKVIDHAAYQWRSPDWRGRPWHEASILEIHIGAFTESGTFRGAIDRLDHVAATGFTAIELMPIADFPGRWNWGYDGVLLYAPDSAYGSPDDLKALVDAAHERGLMVFLDVVYNHFGPEGNCLPRIAPNFFSGARTPWGGAVNYGVPEVRAFAVENAVSWVRDYRFDGLRLDAVHAIATPGQPHILQDISEAVGGCARAAGRYIHLILENDDNRASFLAPGVNAPDGSYRAQWNDDYHHGWHVKLTGETAGYYKDYAEPDKIIARALAEGFAYQGERSAHRDGVARGERSAHLPAFAFVNFLQNHDQIGNRPLGDRLTALVPAAQLEAALAVLLLSPPPPLLFMGEEWGSGRPFPFFCDFQGDLADAVRKGRKAEFPDAYADPDLAVPDPLEEETFRSAILDWPAIESGNGRERLNRVSALLHARQRHVVPLLPGLIPGNTEARFVEDVLLARWQSENHVLHLYGNFNDHERSIPQRRIDTLVWNDAAARVLPPWSVAAGIEHT